MVKDTCLVPLCTAAQNLGLDESRTARPLITATYKAHIHKQIRKQYTKQYQKSIKTLRKDSTRCYDRVSSRTAKIGVRMKKL